MRSHPVNKRRDTLNYLKSFVFPEESKTLIVAYGLTNDYSQEAKTAFVKGSGGERHLDRRLTTSKIFIIERGVKIFKKRKKRLS